MTLFALLVLLLPCVSAHLDLTAFVRSGDYAAAQAAARVQLPDDPLNLTSYSGFVETTPGRHMFMYVHSQRRRTEEQPLLPSSHMHALLLPLSRLSFSMHVRIKRCANRYKHREGAVGRPGG